MVMLIYVFNNALPRSKSFFFLLFSGMEITISKNDLYFEPVEGEPVFQTNAGGVRNSLFLSIVCSMCALGNQ
jgi:hypothetical protein